MQPDDYLNLTPVKKRPDTDLKLINSPKEKQQNLYQRLISPSPPTKLFHYEHDSRMHQDEPESESVGSDEDDQELTPLPKQTPKIQKIEHREEHDLRKEETPVKQSKGCKCQKSHCLKKYCDCYKVGEVCSGDCSCIGCENTIITQQHEKMAKIIELTRSGKGGKETKCKCQKSHCLKNYCECHSGGQKCSPACSCVACQNTGQSTSRSRKRTHFLQVSDWSGWKVDTKSVLFS